MLLFRDLLLLHECIPEQIGCPNVPKDSGITLRLLVIEEEYILSSMFSVFYKLALIF